MRKYTGIILIFLIPLLFSNCHRPSISSPITAAPYARFEHWISWNISFTPVSAPDSISVITALENYVTNWAIGKDPTSRLSFKLLHCPCDTLLTNLDATLVTGSGKPVAPPPSQPNPGPSGDYLVGTNFDMNIPSSLDSNYLDLPNLKPDSTVVITYIPGSDSMNKTLAVIDTGLDSALFQKAYPNSVWAGNLLWDDKAETIFDVVPGEATNLLKDGGTVNHGTAATAIILTQMARMQPNRIPKIMSIRAFDDSEKGSIYTVSCALSYAIKHKADFVNASWGYYGKKDSVLLKYIKRADSAHIRMIAAAGNTPGTHDPTQICASSPNPVNNLDKATTDHLFYPACFAPDIRNLVSVTQIHDVTPNSVHPNLVPCFYQNYSQSYITVGAFEQSAGLKYCCQFKIPFLASNIEGSSFATPAITAQLMFEMAGSNMDIKSFIQANSNVAAPIPGSTAAFYTNEGRYITFQVKH